MERLSEDVESCGALVRDNSGRRLQVYGDSLRGSATFTEIIGRLFSVFRSFELVDCFVNLYRNGGDMTFWHQDCYHLRTPQPTLTFGMSLGATRELAFHHVESGQEIRVSQANGDMFAFDETFNRQFKHSVPLVRPKKASGRRLSVIVWARPAADSPGRRIAVTRSWPSHLHTRAEVPESVDWTGWGALDGCSGGTCGHLQTPRLDRTRLHASCHREVRDTDPRSSTRNVSLTALVCITSLASAPAVLAQSRRLSRDMCPTARCLCSVRRAGSLPWKATGLTAKWSLPISWHRPLAQAV